ncbi:ATP-dependent DNA helicase [Leptolyngbya cf. ectocarpi LEGE 11479]|uniref:ATP-dependent DNA helicase n=1 Tax=Leptolyngbya cf. ectocarpi LEGE 11479 TaxID=1828722 RepID=A0A928X259_LEPEC|nr:helicase C-terminal domain-containing protein [Leptolyngbya ectocarpi]MBE9065673.1 ATP-dependent DNA helicase [Leptolyngbya cf. ectocarpi LEGE 11479]
MIEAEVHQLLRKFLRQQGHTQWPHHLTMARLVARALRLGRSALLQTGSTAAYRGRYRLSYLMPALIWPGPIVLVVPPAIHQQLVQDEIPTLLQTLPTIKSIQIGERWPGETFQGILITTPSAWLSAQLQATAQTPSAAQATAFPPNLVTLIDGIDPLVDWVRTQLTCSLTDADWHQLGLAYPSQQVAIRDLRVRLTHLAFQHPANPYSCYLADAEEQSLLIDLYSLLADTPLGLEALPPVWQKFRQQLERDDGMTWLQLNRESGQLTLRCAPVNLADRMAPIWERQPVVLIGAAVDEEKRAENYRQRLGLDDVTCLKFTPDRQQDGIQLYAPDRLPMPNSQQFPNAILQEIRNLLQLPETRTQPTVILVGDNPLKAQIGSILAAEYGSRVQVERPELTDNGILVTGWEYWQDYRLRCPPPGVLIITTLPIPSLEDPLVAGQVAYYKRQRQDWFRLFLLPTALQTLQLAIAPVSAQQGKVALLDNRVNHRSYGRTILKTLNPIAQSTYLEPSWLAPLNQTL